MFFISELMSRESATVKYYVFLGSKMQNISNRVSPVPFEELQPLQDEKNAPSALLVDVAEGETTYFRLSC